MSDPPPPKKRSKKKSRSRLEREDVVDDDDESSSEAVAPTPSPTHQSPSLLGPNARLVVLGLFGTLAAFFLFGGFSALMGGAAGSGSGEPFDAVPKDSFLIATANVAELRRSPLYEVLLGKESPTKLPKADVPLIGGKALGMDKLFHACGFDPLSRVERLALALPEEGDKGELGLAARVNVTRDELSKCTSSLANEHGGGGKIEAKEVGSFYVVENSAGGDGAAKPRLAYGHGGLLVVGRGAWFDAMLAAADGKKPNAKQATQHAAMRTSLTSKDGWQSPTVLVSAMLPRSLRDRIKNEMGAELGSKDNSLNIMGGVLSVSSVGLAMRASASGGTTDVAIELVCDAQEGEKPGGGREEATKPEDACAAVEKVILRKRLDWSKELTLRMVGLGPLLDSIEVKREGARVRVTAGAATDPLASTIDRILRLKARQGDRDDPPAPRPRLPLPPRRPDETIPAVPSK